MRLLLDTNVLLALENGTLSQRDRRMAAIVASSATRCHVSAVSLWEIAIKVRIGKLSIGPALSRLPGYVEAFGFAVLPVTARHAVANIDPEPATRDPFDRMLLVQCAEENLQLVTFDRVLAVHPLAWRPS